VGTSWSSSEAECLGMETSAIQGGFSLRELYVFQEWAYHQRFWVLISHSATLLTADSHIISSSTTHRLSLHLNCEQTVNFVQLVPLYKITGLRPGVRDQDLSGPYRRHKPPTKIANYKAY
jgi:hypothetical protein